MSDLGRVTGYDFTRGNLHSFGNNRAHRHKNIFSTNNIEEDNGAYADYASGLNVGVMNYYPVGDGDIFLNNRSGIRINMYNRIVLDIGTIAYCNRSKISADGNTRSD